MEALDYEYEEYLDSLIDDEDYMEKTEGCDECRGCFECLMMSWKDFI